MNSSQYDEYEETTSTIDTIQKCVPQDPNESVPNATAFKLNPEVKLVTEISLVVVILYVVLIIILKVMSSSKESLLSANKYDLVLFRIQQQNYHKGPAVMGKALFDNSSVLQHNLKAMKDSGFDPSTLIRNNTIDTSYERNRNK